MMDEPCEHIPWGAAVEPCPPLHGCAECLRGGRLHWVHLRACEVCGLIGCCDSSPGKHATGHYVSSGHPVVRSYEPGENWWWCYIDHVLADVVDSDQASSRPDDSGVGA